MDEEMVLCAASSYEQKYYLNPEFESLPGSSETGIADHVCVVYSGCWRSSPAGV